MIINVLYESGNYKILEKKRGDYWDIYMLEYVSDESYIVLEAKTYLGDCFANMKHTFVTEMKDTIKQMVRG